MSLSNVVRHILRHPLNRGDSIAALTRFGRWQIASRLMPVPMLIPLTDEASILIGKGMHGATQNFYCGLNDFEDMAFLLHFLRSEDVFLDVGANVGAYTVLACSTGAHVVSWEPGPAVAALRRNVALNKGNAVIESKALGSNDGVLYLSSGGSDAMHHIADEGIPVEVRRLDSYNLAPNLMKIDVEGFEAEVLKGAQETLRSPSLQAIIMEDNDAVAEYGGSKQTLTDILADVGFVAGAYDPHSRALTEKTKKSDNTIFFRDRELVQSRLREGRSFSVLGRKF